VSASTAAPPDVRADLAAVVVQYGHADETRATVTAVLAMTPRPRRIVVVDNASPDGAGASIAPWCEAHAVEFLPLASNAGYAGGANAGVRLALADPAVQWVAYCNNDVILEPAYFGALLEALEHEGGAAGSGVLHARRGGLDWAGGHFVAWRALAVSETVDPGREAPPRRTTFVTACAMVVHRRALDIVGLLPEAYAPGYSEDAELSWRLEAAGLTQWVVPAARGVHGIATSFGNDGVRPQVLEWIVRNRLWWARRNLSGVTRVAAVAYQLATKPARSVAELLRGNPAHARAVWRGFWQGLTAPPDASASFPPTMTRPAR
jgi:N-acetylglucosaminyl-diphospho-decaprenol L-rhamnosyltransferase